MESPSLTSAALSVASEQSSHGKLHPPAQSDQKPDAIPCEQKSASDVAGLKGQNESHRAPTKNNECGDTCWSREE